MNLIDSHCHLDLPAFDHDRTQVLQRCRELGITQIVIPGISARHWGGLLQLCRSAGDHGPTLHPALGLHPLFIAHHKAHDLIRLERAIETHHPVAIGEIGLDFYREQPDRSAQQQLFEAQLQIASEARLPVILHIRKAHDQALKTLKKFNLPGGIAHAFNGSLQQAQQYIDLGFKLGFGGTLTYERSTRLRTLAGAVPLESIVLETDAPDMSVATHRGERNSPEYLLDCLAALVDTREEEPDQIARQSCRNVTDCLALPAKNESAKQRE